jgi:hypothetical protein
MYFHGFASDELAHFSLYHYFNMTEPSQPATELYIVQAVK